jgi:hypothetical protein
MKASMLTRRSFAALGLLAPFFAPGHALAALPYPLKEPPPRVKPLGIWALPVRKLEVIQSGGGAVTVDVPLQFKPAIDVEAPLQRWWRLSAKFPIAKTQQTIEPPMVGGYWTNVPITLAIPASTAKGGYRVSCEMVDPVSRRRATYSFLLTVVDRARS